MNMAAGTNIHLSTTLDGPQKQKKPRPRLLWHHTTVIDPAPHSTAQHMDAGYYYCAGRESTRAPEHQPVRSLGTPPDCWRFWKARKDIDVSIRASDLPLSPANYHRL
ncbi:hypothetical protein ONS95_002535 [Cadophora gregata]|uniref:uncharacterized protein n=1 Tax=Cadophora gregata TaxID=51156 RepID=UPI0026DD8A80|nr:uncharacterized protein ONS95_002535 [Cadophora gregata]KAK0109864.1 hypothetical protein ONS95_002535 [Cadophora gregata]